MGLTRVVLGATLAGVGSFGALNSDFKDYQAFSGGLIGVGVAVALTSRKGKSSPLEHSAPMAPTYQAPLKQENPRDGEEVRYSLQDYENDDGEDARINVIEVNTYDSGKHVRRVTFYESTDIGPDGQLGYLLVEDLGNGDQKLGYSFRNPETDNPEIYKNAQKEFTRRLIAFSGLGDNPLPKTHPGSRPHEGNAH